MSVIIVAGLLGGILRGLLGYSKYHFAYKGITFNWKYFIMMVGISAFAGLAITWAVSDSGIDLPFVSNVNPAIAFIIGYAGGDFLENLYKIIIGKDTLFGASR